MSKLIRLSTILAKAETTYGSNPSPGVANGILIGEPTFTVNGSKVTRDFLRATLSPVGHIVGEKSVGIDFDTELKGTGTVNGTPKFDPLLLACGLKKENFTAFNFTNKVGTYTLDEIVTGDTSSCVAAIRAMSTDHLFLDVATVDLTVDSTTGFEVGETVTGDSSAATGKIIQIPDGTSLVLSQVSGTFTTDDNALAGGTSGTTANVGTVTALSGPVLSDELTGATSGATCDSDYGAEVDLTVSSVVGTFVVGETVTAAPSGATGVITHLPDATSIYVASVTGTFTDADALTGGTSGATANCDGVDDDPVVWQPGLLYQPRSAGFGSCTISYFMDGVNHVSTGCRGSVSFGFQVGQYPKASFKMTGNYAAPTDTAASSATQFDTNVPPQVLGVDLKVGSFATPVAEQVTVDLANKISISKSMREADGTGAININGREPGGSVDPDVETLATFNPWTAWDAGTKQTILVDVGSTYGNRVTLYLKEAQFDQPKYRNADGIAKYDIPFTPTGSDDEVKLLIW